MPDSVRSLLQREGAMIKKALFLLLALFAFAFEEVPFCDLQH